MSSGAPSDAEARYGIASCVRPAAIRAIPLAPRSMIAIREIAMGDGCVNGSLGKLASAMMERKSARRRRGSRSWSVATRGRIRAASPAIALRKKSTALASRSSRSSGEARSFNAEAMAPARAML